MAFITHTHTHIHYHGDSHVSEKLSLIIKRLKTMPTQTEVAEQLNAAKAQFQKGISEVLAAVANQENASPELVAAAEGFAAMAQQLDDINPDATTEEPTV